MLFFCSFIFFVFVFFAPHIGDEKNVVFFS